MINLVVAFLEEARPLIDFYQLKQTRFDPFPIYENQDTRLILSKMGALSSACAVTTLHHLYSTHIGEAWLNVGLAGHKEFSIGEGILASKVMHRDYKDLYYPTFTFDLKIKKCPLKTIPQPCSLYESDTLFDMEGFGFYQAASRYATLERIHLFKVISDNAKNPIETFTPIQTKKLIEGQLKSIDHMLQALKKLTCAPMKTPLMHAFLSSAPFTQTQRHWLEKHLPILHFHQPDLSVDAFQGLSAKEILIRLKKELKEVPL